MLGGTGGFAILTARRDARLAYQISGIAGTIADSSTFPIMPR